VCGDDPVTARVLWPDLEPEAIERGWLAEMPELKLSSAQVCAALAARHPMDGWNGKPGRWVFALEVQETTGIYGDAQRFDAVAVGLVPSLKYARIVYEVKVSRSDWLRELKPRWDVRYNGHRRRMDIRSDEDRDLLTASGFTVAECNKWDAALAVSTEFYIAAPARVVQIAELPPEAGLVEIRPWGSPDALRARVVRPAPVRDTPLPDAGFWASMLRSVAAR
jgi:hypothetical protein